MTYGNVTYYSPISYTNVTYTGGNCVTTTYYDYSTVLVDLLYWFLVSGALVYAMPLWEKESSTLMDKVARNLSGSALAGGLLFLVVGLASGSGYLVPVHYLVPFNPFVAFADCASMTFETGRCVTVNLAYYLADYAFWLAVASLAALTASELFRS